MSPELRVLTADTVPATKHHSRTSVPLTTAIVEQLDDLVGIIHHVYMKKYRIPDVDQEIESV